MFNSPGLDTAKQFRINRDELVGIPYNEAPNMWGPLIKQVTNPTVEGKFMKYFGQQFEDYNSSADSRVLNAGSAGAGIGGASAMVAAADTGGASGRADSAMIAGAAASTGAAPSPPPQFEVDALPYSASAGTVFGGADGADLRRELVGACKVLFRSTNLADIDSRVLNITSDLEQLDSTESEAIECLVLMYKAVAEAISNRDIAELNSIREENLREVFSTLIEEGLFSELAEPFYTGLKGLLKRDQGDEARGDVQAFIYELDEQYNAACEVQESIVDLVGSPCFSGA